MRRSPTALLIAASTLLLSLASAAAAQEIAPVVLPVTINAVPRGELTVGMRGDDFLMRVSDLEQFGAGGPLWQRLVNFAQLRDGSPKLRGSDAVALRALSPYVTVQYDEAALALTVTMDPRLITATSIVLQGSRPRDIVYSRDTSTFLNYSLGSFGGLNNSTGFVESGTSFAGKLVYNAASWTKSRGAVRTLSSLIADDRKHLNRWTLGDATTSADTLGGSAIIGGIAFTRMYDLDPYFIRFPSMNLAGMALTPSVVDVYVNGVRVGQQQVPPGPFQLQNIPVTQGAGTTQLVIRDAFGGERVESSSFYYSTGVLGKGLSEFNYAAGARRENFGQTSFDYGAPLLQAYHRYGFTDAITAGGRAEAARELWNAGPTTSVHVPFGDIDAAYGVSGDHGRRGSAALLGYRYLARSVSFGVSGRRMSREYATISQPASADRSLLDVAAFVGFPIARGSLTLQWLSSDMRDAPDTRQLSAQTSFQMSNRMGLYAAANSLWSAGRRTNQYTVGLSLFLAGSTTATIGTQSLGGSTTANVEVQRSLPVGTGGGYRLHLASAEDGEQRGSADLQYQTSFGRYGLGFDPFDVHRSPNVNLSGGLVYEGGRSILTRPVQQSFALVRVGVPNVRVYVSNQLVGRTDANGDLLLPNLLSYYGNRIRIEDKDVPLEYELTDIEQTMAPPYRGGSLVRFHARRVQTVTGSVVIREGDSQVVPAYGELVVTRDGRSWSSPLGAAGEFYLESVAPGSYQAEIRYKDGSCDFHLELPAGNEPFVKLGRQVCTVRRSTP